MSRISGIRMININYNHNTMKIDDEYYDLNGEHTLISLRNGGGKSVLVQMMIAPFVHKRFRNTADRPFSSFFTTSRPSFIMMEWQLDGTNRCVLIGMMIRKNQENEEGNEDLEMIAFLHEYIPPHSYDIRTIPVIDEISEGKRLKGFQTCKKLFEDYKQKTDTFFNYYDLRNASHQRNYFEKLKQYQINYKEWETIIKKVNLKESGLSELFTEAKDEHGLVERWFIPAIEDKLNQEENRMEQFEVILGKYIRQYKENQTKLERKEMLHLFKEKTIPVYEKAKEYQESLCRKTNWENRIAALLKRLDLLKEAALSEKEKALQEFDFCVRELTAIRYEAGSLAVYEKQARLEHCEELLLQKSMELNGIIKEIEEVKKKQYILQCAKYHEGYQEESKEVQKIENKLDIVKREDADLLPERNQIGYNLRLHYENEEKRLKNEINLLEEQLVEWKRAITGIRDTAATLRKQERTDAERIGKLEAMISNYSVLERNFNDRYEEALARNILGYYENGYFNQLSHSYQKNLEEKNRQNSQVKKRLLELEQSIIKANRDGEDIQNQLGIRRTQLAYEEKLKEDYDAELLVRKSLLQLLSLTEEDLLNKEKCMAVFRNKLKEAEVSLHEMKNEEETLLTEYKKLESGKVLELSKDLEEALDSAGIQYIYGMDWLAKNNYPVSRNQSIVKENPFLPYSLIMSRRECDRFMKSELSVFTSFPIPIILRENLESISDKRDYLDSEQVRFYIFFNEKLLDEKELSAMLADLQLQIDLAKKNITHKNEEKEFYEKKRDVLQGQAVTGEKYGDCEKRIREWKEEIKEKEEQAFLSKKQLDYLSKEKRQKEQEDRELELDLSRLADKQKDFLVIREAYDIYLDSQDELRLLTDAVKKREGELKRLEAEESQKQTERMEKDKDRGDKLRTLHEIKMKGAQYSSFKEGEPLHKDVEDLKARFEAITSKVAEEQKSLEEQLLQANKRFKKCEEDLLHYSQRYKITEKEYKAIVYDRFMEEELERVLDVKAKQADEEKEKEGKLSTQKAVLENEISIDMKGLMQEFQTEVLKPKEEIVVRDFDADISRLELSKRLKNEQLKQIEGRITLYEENLSVLTEYDHFTLQAEVIFEEDFERFDKNEWNLFRGNMLRDYKQSEREGIYKRQELAEGLQQVLNEPLFADEFYSNPLKRLYELRNAPDMLVEQIEIVWGSFDGLLEKLAVDLAFLGIEKEKITDMFLDYIKDAHGSMDKIDQNSSITVRNRTIKMLRIKLPEWEEQEDVYQLRMKEFLEEIFSKGLELLQANEQIEEMLGKQITTRNLYDRVVGIGNVAIRLYKIEEQREYPISWAEVAKNSGGEGFLSAFVILSSLLSFMRRDETDIFSEREESKVLIMDNPFAQASSAHLLKPLMEVADKSNTQLICLSGLGGDSIYNRFDQIYVLNLIPSSLKSGISYLRSEHVKGEEDLSRLVSARIKLEEAEQLSLF